MEFVITKDYNISHLNVTEDLMDPVCAISHPRPLTVIWGHG